VVERGRDQLQIGMAEGRRVILPKTAPVVELLDALQSAEPPPEDTRTQALLDLLADAQALADTAGSGRRRADVAVHGTLGVDPAPLLAMAGLSTTDPAEAEVTLLLSAGELDRDLLDDLFRAGRPHLIVRVVDEVTTLGPFVQPYETACLRCLDRHHAEEDPAYLDVVRRYAQASGRPRGDGIADPIDPLLATLATCWAARDLCTHLDGGRPATWSSTLDLAPRLAGITARTWLRHPECPCSWAPGWAPAGPASGTLEW
jgi:hypothetical protein